MKADRKRLPEKKDKREVSGNNLGVIPVEKLIIRMSLPAVFGVLAYNIYGILDIAFIAKDVGTDAAGGNAVSFPLLLFLSAISSTLGSGSASVISRALGEGNRYKAGRVAANTFGLFWLVALLVTVFSKQLLCIFSNDARVVENGSYILRIINAGAAFTGYKWLLPLFTRGLAEFGVKDI